MFCLLIIIAATFRIIAVKGNKMKKNDVSVKNDRAEVSYI